MSVFFFLRIRRPPRSTRTDTLFPTRRSSDLRGQLPLPHQRPPGCYFAPRCDFFQAGNCDREGLAMTQVPGEPGHDVRCRRWQQIDRSTYKPEGVGAGASPAGQVVPSPSNLSKYYDITDKPFARYEHRHGGTASVSKCRCVWSLNY